MTGCTTRREFLKRSTLTGIGLSIAAAAPAQGDSPGEKSSSARAGSPLLERLPANRPTPQQAAWHDLELGMFVHFGLYAVAGRFTGITWVPEGANPLYSGSLQPVDPGIFNPVAFDAAKWVATAQAGGARYLLLTAKHHDGFCLWPTATTPHSVKATRWRGGRGDLVGEVARACHAAGLRFGFYLSPWDAYAWQTLKLSDAEYDKYYMRQLTELLTQYGKISEVWWDGAGASQRRHDWRAYYRLVKTLQPDSVIMGAGCSDVRWIWEVPEEQGLGLDPNWYVVHVPELTAEKPVRTGGMSLWPKDQPAGDYWWPGESYLAMDRFWSGATRLGFEEHLKKDTAHTAEDVVAAWHRTVGYGLNLVVNFVPRPRGDLPPAEVERFSQAGKTLRRIYARNLAIAGTATASRSTAGHGPGQAVDGNPATWWEASDSARTAWLEMDLGQEVEFDRLALREAITQGQAIAAFRLLAKRGGGWEQVCAGGTVGRQRIALFRPLRASRVRVELTTTGRPATLREIGLYRGQE